MNDNKFSVKDDGIKERWSYFHLLFENLMGEHRVESNYSMLDSSYQKVNFNKVDAFPKKYK